MSKVLSLGDCNTLGVSSFKNNAYPEKFSSKLSFEVINCGFTMSTTKEGINFFEDFYDKNIDIITIQYGLVDSWQTFKYSPYVLYYPDNNFRKIFRKIVKKYKKLAKKFGLNYLFGVKNVISKEEYKRNLLRIIKKTSDKKIFLIETIPNKDISRNERIQEYNLILKDISLEYKNCKLIKIYDCFYKNFDTYYYDDTHMNELGHEYIAERLFKEVNSYEKN